MFDQIRKGIFRVLIDIAFVFEPLAPAGITYFLSQRFDRFKSQDKILDYQTQAKRLGKYHYAIELSLDLNGKQIFQMINDALQLKHIGDESVGESRNGNMKILIDVKTNENLMEALKEAMSNMNLSMPDVIRIGKGK